jgi:ABC-2 type transport system permease protein
MALLRAILVKELLQLLRDPKLLPILFVAPVFQLIILGYAATTDIRHVELAVCDLDRSASSRALVERFTASTYFRITATVDSQMELDHLLESGTARLGLTIPPGFAADRSSGRPARVQLLADGSDAASGTTGLAYAHTVLSQVGLGPGQLPVLEMRPTILFNPDLVSRNFMVPATLAMILMIMTMMLTSMAVVREVETGTMEQLLVTPLTPGQLIAGKLIPYALVGLVEVVSTLPIVLLWFRVPLQGSLGVLLLLTFPFMLCMLGLGLLVSTLARTQQQAMMISAFVFLMPQIYLSGLIFPIRNMPVAFQWLTTIIPLRYYTEILRGIFLKGVGLDVLWPQGLALLAMGIGIVAAARLRFRRRLV